MEVVVLWIIFALIVGAIGSGTTWGFLGCFLFSLLLSPLIGLIVVLFLPSQARKDHEYRVQQQILYNQQQEIILQQQQRNTPPPPPPLSTADEIDKLSKLKDAGHITQEEFDAQKKKLLN